MNELKFILKEFYLDYVNNFLTKESLAEYYGLELSDVMELLKIGKKIHKQMTERNK